MVPIAHELHRNWRKFFLALVNDFYQISSLLVIACRNLINIIPQGQLNAQRSAVEIHRWTTATGDLDSLLMTIRFIWIQSWVSYGQCARPEFFPVVQLAKSAENQQQQQHILTAPELRRELRTNECEWNVLAITLAQVTADDLLNNNNIWYSAYIRDWILQGTELCTLDEWSESKLLCRRQKQPYRTLLVDRLNH